MAMIGRTIVSLLLCSLGFATILLIQWIAWDGPKILRMHYGPISDDNLGISFLVAIPLLACAGTAFICAIRVWTIEE